MTFLNARLCTHIPYRQDKLPWHEFVLENFAAGKKAESSGLAQPLPLPAVHYEPSALAGNDPSLLAISDLPLAPNTGGNAVMPSSELRLIGPCPWANGDSDSEGDEYNDGDQRHAFGVDDIICLLSMSSIHSQPCSSCGPL
jgi:hypothetical protein